MRTRFSPRRKGLLTTYDQDLWKDIIGQVGLIHICTYQLESARACFAWILAWPGRLALIHHVNALCSMAACHKACDDWDKVIESCEEALTLIPCHSGRSLEAEQSAY